MTEAAAAAKLIVQAACGDARRDGPSSGNSSEDSTRTAYLGAGGLQAAFHA